MSEYQYYEFQAIDRPLTQDDQAFLRAISSRARITGTSFTNHYEWGDFKGDPLKLMERCFDLHLYLANWGSRRFMMRLPKAPVQRKQLEQFTRHVDGVTIKDTSGHLILDISRDEVEAADWDDGSGWLGALAPLRAELLSGDRRVLYLVWLMAVDADEVAEDDLEPLPGIGPMTGALEAFANFFGIGQHLVSAAAERQSEASDAETASAARHVIADMNDRARTDMLLRLFDGDPHVGAELRAKVQKSRPRSLQPNVRTVGELKARTQAIRAERLRSDAKKAAENNRAQAEKMERERQARLRALKQRGEYVWRDVETEVERRAGPGYEKAASLLVDLHEILESQGQAKEFARRLADIRERHSRKPGFLKRIVGL